MRCISFCAEAFEVNHQLMFNFEKLDVWQEAIEFADFVYSVTRTFPDDERFGLTNQMRRAAVSIASNIAEGSSRSSRLDFARFIELATGSLYEVVSQSTISKRQGFLSEDEYGQLYAVAKSKAGCSAASGAHCSNIKTDQRSAIWPALNSQLQPSTTAACAYSKSSLTRPARRSWRGCLTSCN